MKFSRAFSVVSEAVHPFYLVLSTVLRALFFCARASRAGFGACHRFVVVSLFGFVFFTITAGLPIAHALEPIELTTEIERIEITKYQSGELHYQVDMQEGFENIPDTLQRLFTGKNIGKQLLKIADPS